MSKQFYTGFIPTPESTKAKFSAFSLPLVPESDWQEINRRAYFNSLIEPRGKGWFAIQRQCNGCTGLSSGSALSKARAINGQPPIKLAGLYLYSLINGGSDRGSNIGDSWEAIRTHGCPPEALCNINDDNYRDYIYRENTKQFDGEAARFKGDYAVTVHSEEEAATVIQKGGILEFAVYVDRRGQFASLDSEGVSRMSSGQGNHAVHADGLKKTNGRGWCLDMQTWGPDFGDNGRALIPLDMLDRINYQEMWGIFSTIDDPNDTHDPPTPN